MSLLSSAFKAVGRIASKVAPYTSMIPGPVGAVSAGVGIISAAAKGGKAVSAAMPGVGAAAGKFGKYVGPVLKSGGGVLRKVGKVAGVAATGYAIYDAAGNLIGHRNKTRRINPMNYRALNRALKRVCRAKDLSDRLNRIDIKKQPGKRGHRC